VHEPPPLLSRLRPYLDARLEAILLMALHKEPEARFRSARQFSEALAGLAVTAPTAPMPVQIENQATPNHALEEGNAPAITWLQIAAGVFGVLALTLGVGFLAGGIVSAAISHSPFSDASIAAGFGAGVTVLGILTLASAFWSWKRGRTRRP
jgi:hypothetical protein